MELGQGVAAQEVRASAIGSCASISTVASYQKVHLKLYPDGLTVYTSNACNVSLGGDIGEDFGVTFTPICL